MAQPISELPVSLDEFLKLEESSTVKHEYVAGDIYGLAGASRQHNRIAGNIFARLLTASRGGPCRVYISDVKLRAAQDAVYYPDIMVVCGPEPDHPLIEDAPCLLIEVTSPSTELTDRREKLLVYKRIESLEAYLIVHQNTMRVERHWRDERGICRYVDLIGDGLVRLPCPEIELALDDVYEGIDLGE